MKISKKGRFWTALKDGKVFYMSIYQSEVNKKVWEYQNANK